METDEELEDGCGVDAPAGDNLCNDFAQGLAESYLTLARARGERVVDDDPDVALADGGSPSLFGNIAVLRRPLRDAGWAEVADRMHDFFGGHPGGSYLVFSAWPTPDLRDDGFGAIGHPPLLLRPPGPVEDRPVEGLEIRPVGDEATAVDWERTFVDGWPEPALQPARLGCLLPAAALAAERWHHWVGYLDGAPVATASAFVGDRHVDVDYVATLPDARGRGIGRALTATASTVAPDRPAMLIASDDGRGVYEGLGYIPLLRFTMWAGHRR